MHAGIAKYRFPLKSVSGKTFPAHAQPAILRIWWEAYVATEDVRHSSYFGFLTAVYRWFSARLQYLQCIGKILWVCIMPSIYIYISKFEPFMSNISLTHWSISDWLLFNCLLFEPYITHWGRNKMAATLQTTYLNTFSWVKMVELLVIFPWNLFLWVQLTIS